MRDNEENRAVVEAALLAAWEAVPQAFIDKLVDSMPARMTAVRQAQGWYTRY